MERSTDAILVYNYQCKEGSHSWQNIPPNTWRNILRRLDVLGVNGCGFQNVTKGKEGRPLKLFNGQMRVLAHATYAPYHELSSQSVSVFELTDELLAFLLDIPFDDWTRTNDDFPYDEVVFFSGNNARIQAVPYENIVMFYALSDLELRSLVSSIRELRGNLYTPDMRQLSL